MAISFVASGAATFSTAGSVKQIAIPASTVVGDLIVVDYLAATGAGPAATPAGFTAGPTASDNCVLATYYRVAQSGDAGQNVTVSQSGTGSRAQMMITVYRGVATSGSVGQTNTATESGTSATHVGGSITTSATSWVRRTLAVKDGATPSTTITAPSGFTLRESSPGNTLSSVNQLGLAVADTGADVAAGSQTGTWTVDQTTSDAAMVVMELVPTTTTVTVRPDATVSTTGCTIVGGATGHAVTADNDPATYIEVPTGGTFTIKLALETPPSALKSVTIKFYGSGSPVTMSVQAKLAMSGTPIVNFATETAVVTSETTKTYTIDAAGQAAQTTLTDLEVWVVCTVT